MKFMLKSVLILLLVPALTSHAALTVTNIASGNYAYHSLFLKSDGSLWAMGYNNSGQLGDGTLNKTNRSEQIVPGGVTAIAAGAGHSLFIKSDGSLWGMGGNSDGQLGDSTGITTNRPELIVTNGVVAIAAGLAHSLFLKSDHSLWAMGDDSVGQLGDGGYGYTNRPELIVTNGVTAIAAGGQFSLFLKTNGSLWAMGDRTYGQLGDGSAGYFTNRPEQIVASNVTAIAAGYIHSLFLKSDGSLWAMGYNIYGELGDGFIDTSVPADFGTDIPEQILPLPQPVLLNRLSSKTNLQINATTGFGGTFYLKTGTNLAQLASQWTKIRTNSITTRSTNNFTATITNAVHSSASQQFYILQSQ
jgi:alpha-tubulin suppressor-like RCC1 family protein